MRSPEPTIVVPPDTLGLPAPTIVTGFVRSRSPVSEPDPPLRTYVPAGTVMVAPVDALAAATAARNEQLGVAAPAVHAAPDVKSV